MWTVEGTSRPPTRRLGCSVSGPDRVAALRDLRCPLKTIGTTDEGKLSIAIERAARDPDALAQIRDLIFFIC